MKIKLSKSDWASIGSKMGWFKKAQAFAPWEREEPHRISDKVDIDMESMSVDEFPDVVFNGMYTISYDYAFPEVEGGDDEISIRDISVVQIGCEWVAEGKACPSDQEMEMAKKIIRGYLLNPKHGWDHEDQIRQDAKEKDDRPYYDPDSERKNLMD